MASLDTGFTPLIDAPRLADRLGVARVWVKNDAVLASLAVVQGPRRRRRRSTRRSRSGSTRWAARRRATSRTRWRARGARGARVVDLHPRGPRDRQGDRHGGVRAEPRAHQGALRRREPAVRAARRPFGWGIVNVNLRGYYGEGSKTMAYEIAEQLGWRLPSAIVAPMAGGSLVTKLGKGFKEFIDAGLVRRRDAARLRHRPRGAPIVRLWERGDSTLVPEIPNTIARSIAIGNPADGPFAAKVMGNRRPWAARERRGARRGHPAARRDDGRVHRDRRWRDRCRWRSRWPRPGTSVPTTRLYCASRGTD